MVDHLSFIGHELPDDGGAVPSALVEVGPRTLPAGAALLRLGQLAHTARQRGVPVLSAIARVVERDRDALGGSQLRRLPSPRPGHQVKAEALIRACVEVHEPASRRRVARQAAADHSVRSGSTHHIVHGLLHLRACLAASDAALCRAASTAAVPAPGGSAHADERRVPSDCGAPADHGA
eukprot:scaffold40182_cov67-Phaeocystis_antarctica.AAC.4